MLKLSLVNLVGYLKARYTSKFYNIGFAAFSNDISSFSKINKVNWLKNTSKSRWFADPFIVDYDDETITVLVEEMDYRVRKGIIVELIIDRFTYDIINRYVVLNLDTHLSFPAIHRDGSTIYVYPENSKSGKSFIYIFDREQHCFIGRKTLSNNPLTDAVIIDSKFNYILSTDSFAPNGNKTSLYKRNGEIFEKQNFYTFNSNIARNAGTPFMVENELVRPAQDCNGGYGKGVVFQYLRQDINGFIKFETFDSLYPFDKVYCNGLHTFNVYKDLIVLDSYKLPNIACYRIVNMVVSFLLRIRQMVKK